MFKSISYGFVVTILLLISISDAYPSSDYQIECGIITANGDESQKIDEISDTPFISKQRKRSINPVLKQT